MHRSISGQFTAQPLQLTQGKRTRRISEWLAVVGTLAFAVVSATAQTAGTYTATNIMSDGFVSAPVMDPSFINPWGVAGGKTLWIDTAGAGLSYVTSIAGVISFKAVIPPASGTGLGLPTGTVQNSTNGFLLSNGTKASFLFASLDGVISGWNAAQSAGGNHALIAVNNNSKSAVYTDMALVTNSTSTYLLVANFGAGAAVEIYDQTFKPATLAGSFTDPNVPAGYAPYSIKALGSQVFVCYMLRTTPPVPTGSGLYQEILGTNTGFVSVFDTSGNFVTRAVTGGNLNAPWGVAIAPAGFGIYAGDLLIGNFGDGLITAYNPTTYAYLGVVADGTGKPIANPGLWEIFMANGTGDPTAIYFTAGISNERHGLFGSITNSTTASGAATFNLSASTQVASVAAGSSTTMVVSIAPINSFAGTVNLSCSRLPLNTTCSFSPTQLTVSATAPSTATLTIKTASGSAMGGVVRPGLKDGVILALLLPLGLAGLRRRIGTAGRLTIVAVAMLVGLGAIAGCTYNQAIFTPPGTSSFAINASSGNATQTTTVSLTVK
ncbi:MAG TPA: TIGR03118 family protein [Acidobacteriaceae bacterium]|jgi:uncharacterized protein (TIGR03118 family)|nr:TIGR03118 family protein [Acidobacteriaceae bacterium]